MSDASQLVRLGGAEGAGEGDIKARRGPAPAIERIHRRRLVMRSDSAVRVQSLDLRPCVNTRAPFSATVRPSRQSP